MVTGFSLVLYSRLNIICQNRRTRQFVLGMIIFNGIVWHTAMTITSAEKAKGRNAGYPGRLPLWKSIDYYFERIQIMIFSSQETIISFFYMRAAYQYVNNGFAQKGKIRQNMTVLVLVQLVIIAFDIAMITIDFAGLLQLKLFIHSFVYSAKLELEFVVLNQLVELSRLGLPGLSISGHDEISGPESETLESTRKLPYRTAGLINQSMIETLDLESRSSRASKPSMYTLDFITIPARL